jgi:isochorismate pyruvate lyase
MKTPNDCENMAEIRAEIDQLDRQVIALIGRRFAYVKAASKFKNSETSVKLLSDFNQCCNNVVFGQKKRT